MYYAPDVRYTVICFTQTAAASSSRLSELLFSNIFGVYRRPAFVPLIASRLCIALRGGMRSRYVSLRVAEKLPSTPLTGAIAQVKSSNTTTMSLRLPTQAVSSNILWR